MYFVYVLKSERSRKSYVGHTDNLEKRLLEHNFGKNTSTKPFAPWVRVYHEEYKSREAAVKREKYLKSRGDRRFFKNVVFST
ncbi:MAG TPA: GIY-YIG nuclease family protein [Candidatus Paceibacterota bacterium]|nr:GIY-YIG nuclease family protein [Candidatus Paceibacterota bacterium]